MSIRREWRLLSFSIYVPDRTLFLQAINKSPIRNLHYGVKITLACITVILRITHVTEKLPDSLPDHDLTTMLWRDL
jgi:hypothetical protein